MEVAHAAPTGARNGGFSMPPMSSSSSQPSRKEWRVVSAQSVRNSRDEGFERSKLVQSDERLIYEVHRGREPVNADFGSVTIDGGLDNDIMQQRLLAVAKQREELQQTEIELRVQVIARSEILGMQKTFDSQIKEHANANDKLQEQLREKELKMNELERKMVEKEKELHAIRLDNEAAWAKDDLLREQSKELQSCRRERDNSEAERVQHVKQIHDLQEHILEKDCLFMELQDQHRIAQETIIFKDDQLREAQAWITRAQEMDDLRLTTNHTLQAELHERTEHYNQLWLGCQRQFSEIERLHLHLQQLQLELADVREKSGSNLNCSQTSQEKMNAASELGNRNGCHLDVNGDASQNANSGYLQNGNSDSASGVNTLAQGDHTHVTFAPPSLHGMPTYIPTGQMTAFHPFVMHQQGLSVPSHIMQSHFYSVSAMSPTKKWQNQQVNDTLILLLFVNFTSCGTLFIVVVLCFTMLKPQPDGQHVPSPNQYPQETEQNMLRTNFHYDHETSGNGQIIPADYSNTIISQGLAANSMGQSANGEGQVIDSIVQTYDNTQSLQRLQQLSSQFRDALSLDPLERGKESKRSRIHIEEKTSQQKPLNPVCDHGMEKKNTMSEHSNLSMDASSFEAAANAETFSETTSIVDLADSLTAAGHKSKIIGKPGDSYLLDERALLAFIARTMGTGGRIRISTMLPNRLAKMLAPLHWYDYKKKYGKLDDFVASHPEFFSIEGDYIQLRDGAQEIIAATSAVAEVATAAPSLYSSLLPSVAVTSMAQSQRAKTASSSYAIVDKASCNEFAGPKPNDGYHHASQFSPVRSQSMSGGSLCVGGGSIVKILSKGKDHLEMNGIDYSQGEGRLHGRQSMENNRTSNWGCITSEKTDIFWMSCLYRAYWHQVASKVIEMVAR
ncbi:hypothetical protein OROGR_016097 [Orobanche gracilis]